MNLTNIILKKRKIHKKHATYFYLYEAQILAKLNSIRDVLVSGKIIKKYKESLITKSE